MRLEKNRDTIVRKVKPRVDLKDKIDGIMYDNKIRTAIDGLFKTSDLSSYPTQINPMEMITNFTKVTVKGEGGIQER